MNKKITLIISFLLLALVSHAQFPGKHPELLLNHEVKVSDLDQSSQKYGYRNFYDDEKMNYKSVYKGGTSTKYEELVGKTFKVTEVRPYEKYGEKKFMLVLSSPDIKKPLYFDYNPSFDHDYHFEVVGGLTLPADLYCEDMEVTKDKFTDKVTTKSPYTNGISFIKVTEKSASTIYMAMNQPGATLNVGKKGLILLLANGKKIEKPDEPVDVKVNTAGSGYLYSVFVRLTKEDIALLSENPMTDNRLYVYDGTISNGNKLMEYLRCLAK